MSELRVELKGLLGDFRLDIAELLSAQGITAVFGPSGAGKSTLLRGIAGLEPGLRGRVMFRDECWLDSSRGIFVPPHKRGVGFVFQDARLFAFRSVAGNLRYAQRRAPPGHGPGMNDVVNIFDLGALLDRATGELSGGERQRVAIARALLARPRLLLMDEPFSANDVARREELLPYVRALADRFEVPVLYVSHSVEEVAFLADRMLVLRQGSVHARGPVDEVLERLGSDLPDGPFEAGVLLHGSVRAHDDRYCLTSVQVGAEVFVVPRLEHPLGAAVRLRIRARDVSIAVQEPIGLSIRNVLPARVIAVVADRDGPYAELTLRVDSSRLRARITRAALDDLGIVSGSAVHVLVKSVTIDEGAGDRASSLAPTTASHPTPVR
ncbi:MAG: molybdenum ABC transporter ATP-binding protein [Pseudomonadales bacterium]